MKAANDDNVNSLPGRRVDSFKSLVEYLRVHGYRNPKKTYVDTALDYVAFRMTEDMGFEDWKGHDVAEHFYEIIRGGQPALNSKRAQEWFRELIENESEGEPTDERLSVEEYFKRGDDDDEEDE